MDFVSLVRDFGWPGAILTVTGLAAWQVSRFLKDKFFNDDPDARGKPKGFVPRVVESHLEMVAAVKKTAEDNSTVLMANEQTNREILMLVKEGREDTRAMNRLLLEMHQDRLARVPAPPITGVGSV